MSKKRTMLELPEGPEEFVSGNGKNPIYIFEELGVFNI